MFKGCVFFAAILLNSAVASAQAFDGMPGPGFRDGQILPKPTSGTANDAPDTIYIFAPADSHSIICSFEKALKPVAYMRYDELRKRLWLRTGFPHEYRLFQNVHSVPLPEAPQSGVSVLMLNDGVTRAMAYQADNQGGYIATWVDFPGMPFATTGRCERPKFP